jgi:tetratricopeptide (TPR) repeat protein
MRGSDDPLARVKVLYEHPVTRERTEDMRRLLDQSAAETAAYTAVTDLCRYLNRWDNVGPTELGRLEPIIQQALQYDPQFYLAHYALGFLRRARGQHQEALDAFEETIKNAPPTFSRVHAQKGEQLLYLGKFPECIREVNRALEINPNSQVRGYYYWVLGRAGFFQEDYELATQWLQRSIRAWPQVWYNRAYLISTHALRKQDGAARRVRQAFDKQFPGYTLAQIVRNEQDATPCDNSAVREGRDRFHQGLKLAGFP